MYSSLSKINKSNKYNLLPLKNMNIPKSYIKKNIHKITSRIPLFLFQTWSTLDLPDDMMKCVEKLKTNNPEFKYYLYDDLMCRDFIRTNFDENVLYTYDKLKPGAYKADLWRYCILYKYGGIYLDIKFECIDNFKLIELTEKEYFVRDCIWNEILGIYQALLVCYPKNPILLKCINKVVENVKNNNKNDTALSICGPHMMNLFFYDKDILKFDLIFDGTFIKYNNKKILQSYKNYRNNQKLEKLPHYSYLWYVNDVYYYPKLKYKNRICLSRFENNFYTGTPFLIKYDKNNYFVAMKWINYSYFENGSKTKTINLLSKSSYFLLQDNSESYIEPEFNIQYNNFDLSEFEIINIKIISNLEIEFDLYIDIEDIKCVNSNFHTEIFEFNNNYDEVFLDKSGIEDIRVFKFNDCYHFSLSNFNTHINRCMNCCIKTEDIFDIKNTFNYTTTDFIYDSIHEKNWVYFEFEGELKMIYNWFPLTICNIDYNSNVLSLNKYIFDVPEIFKETRGSTCGVKYNNEIWFIVHTAQKYINNNTSYYNYQHYFVVFDETMNLKKYSECFKFDNKKVEFCTCLIIEKDRVLIPHSTLDTNSYIGIYDMKTIQNDLKWFDEW